MDANFLAFCLAAALLAMTPGLDTALVLRSTAALGPGPAFRAALGVAVGCLVWGALAATGVGALIAASPTAFAALKWAGAIYLAVVGLGLLRRRAPSPTSSAEEDNPTSALSPFLQGVTQNLLNPKVGVFYVAFLPQFLSPGASGFAAFGLASIHAGLGLAWFAGLIGLFRRLAPALRNPNIIAALDRIIGIVFIAFAGKLAVAAR